MATSDPLPAAFSATLGRVLPMSGAEGVALLVTVVVELISCFGLAGLTVLNKDTQDQQRAPPGNSSPLAPSAKAETTEAARDPAQGQSPEIAQVIHFPSARVRAGACPPTPTKALRKPSRAPEGQALGKLGPPAHLPKVQPKSPFHSLPTALPKPVGLALPLQRP